MEVRPSLDLCHGFEQPPANSGHQRSKMSVVLTLCHIQLAGLVSSADAHLTQCLASEQAIHHNPRHYTGHKHPEKGRNGAEDNRPILLPT